MIAGVERECKFDAPAGFELPDLARDGLVAVPLPAQDLEATYYDTPDLRLSRAGASLRHRNGRWTVKLPVAGGDGPGLVRREFDVDGPAEGGIPAELAGLVRAYVRSSSLAAVGMLATRRVVVQLQDAGTGAPVIEVADDEVAVVDGGEVVARFREVEVELLDGAASDLLAAVAAEIETAGAGPADPTPKIVRALGERAKAPPEVVVPKLRGRSTLGEVVAASVAAAADRLIRHDAGVRVGDDDEHVHQARVATRRLRSDLRTFRSAIDPEANAALRAELQWLGQELGHVRDADVLRQRLGKQIAECLPTADADAGAALLARLDTERAGRRAALLAVLDGDRYLALLDRLVAGPPPLEDAASARADEVLPAIVAKAWKHLHGAVAGLGPDPEDAPLHEVRIRAKRARYAAEAAAGVVGKPAAKFAKAVAGVQGVLGDLQDAVVAEGWLRRVGAEAPPAEGMAAGQLVAVQRRAAADARRQWPDAWAEADHKKLRAWLS